MTEDCGVKDCPFDAVKWGKFEEKLDNMHEDIKETKLAVQKQNGRVRKLEIWRGYVVGIGAAIAFVIASFMKWVLK